MSLRIHLDSPGAEAVYFPGQTVSGKVIGTFVKQQPVATVSIEFRGKIDTEYAEGRGGPAGNTHGVRKRAHETIRLFSFSQELFRGPYDIPPQTFEWPFTFTIPKKCQHQRTNNTAPGFIPDGWSDLPPTFEWFDHTVAHDARARIKYKLVASLQSGGMFKNHEIEMSVIIARFIQKCPPKPGIQCHEFKPAAHWSSNSLRPQGLTFREKFKNMTSDDPAHKTPCIAFRAFVHLPEYIASNHPVPLLFSIQHARLTPNDPEEPVLSLHQLNLSLKSVYAMTAAKTGRPLVGGDRFCSNDVVDCDKRLQMQPTLLPLDGSPVHISDDVQVREWMGNGRILGDFTTYTVLCTHRLRVEAEIRHAASGHSFVLRSEFPLGVLDAYQEQPPNPYNSIPSVGVSRRQDYSDDPELPSYDTHAHDRPPEHEDAMVSVKS